MRSPLLTASRVLAFAGTLLLWSWLARRSLPPAIDALWIIGALLPVAPVSWAGRRLLGADPTPVRVATPFLLPGRRRTPPAPGA